MNTLSFVTDSLSGNLDNRFTGWTDVALTPQGESDAGCAGAALKGLPSICIHFVLSVPTTRLPMCCSLRVVTTFQPSTTARSTNVITEICRGLNKAETADKYGADQVKLWRRSYDTRPPNGESDADCERCTLPFFKQYILPFVEQARTSSLPRMVISLRPISST